MNSIEELFEKETSNPFYRTVVLNEVQGIDKDFVLEFNLGSPCGIVSTLTVKSEGRLYKSTYSYSDFSQFNFDKPNPFTRLVYKHIEIIERERHKFLEND